MYDRASKILCKLPITSGKWGKNLSVSNVLTLYILLNHGTELKRNEMKFPVNQANPDSRAAVQNPTVVKAAGMMLPWMRYLC